MLSIFNTFRASSRIFSGIRLISQYKNRYILSWNFVLFSKNTRWIYHRYSTRLDYKKSTRTRGISCVTIAQLLFDRVYSWHTGVRSSQYRFRSGDLSTPMSRRVLFSHLCVPHVTFQQTLLRYVVWKTKKRKNISTKNTIIPLFQINLHTHIYMYKHISS